jgi:L-lactate dehydrogenase complex protein LldG
MASRDTILNKLRAARQPFADAAPRPQTYRPVAPIADEEDLLARFTAELTALDGEVFPVSDVNAARACILDLLAQHPTERIAAWHFKHIPVPQLYTAIQAAGYRVDYPHIHNEDRADELARLETAQVGLTGADAAIAATGSLVVTTGKGKSRIPTVLPPVHIAVIQRKQLRPRIEDWMAAQRADNLAALQAETNVCFITGPSRTADIEKQLVVGVHGPGRLQVVVVER